MRNISRPRLIATVSAGATVATLFMAAALPATADNSTGLPSFKPLPAFSARVGAYFPTNDRLKKNVGNTLIVGGIDYVLSRQGPSDESIISVDYIDRSNGSNHLQMVPITIGGIHYMDVKATTRNYIGYGVGAYITSVSVPNSVGFQESNHTTLYGGYINAGIEFTDNVFLDGRYHFTQAVGSTNPSGFEVTAGVRF
jgi:hypothetical protein